MKSKDHYDGQRIIKPDSGKYGFLSGLGKTVILLFLGLSMIPVLIIAVLGYQNSKTHLRESADNQLNSILNLKRDWLEDFFSHRFSEAELLAETQETIKIIEELRANIKNSGLSPQEYVRSSEWKKVFDDYSGEFVFLKSHFDFRDMFLLDEKGNVIFALNPGKDLGINVFSDETVYPNFRSTCLKIAKTDISDFSDFEPRGGDYNQISGFIVHPVYDNNEKLIGYVSFVRSLGQFNKIMCDYAGLGKTGESYLVGPDLLMRSDSRFSATSSVLNQKVETPPTLHWMQDFIEQSANTHEEPETQTYTSYNGTDVLGLCRNVTAGGFSMGIVVEMTESEIFEATAKLRNIIAVLLAAILIIVFLLAIKATAYLVAPLRRLTEVSERIADRTDIPLEELDYPAKNEIGRLYNGFKRVIESNTEITEISGSIAEGDFGKSAVLRSDQDKLGRSINLMIDNFRNVVTQSNAIAHGDYSVVVRPRSPKDELGIAIKEMTQQLQMTTNENKRQIWLSEGLSRLSEKMRGDKSISELTKSIIAFLATYLDAQIGAIFIKNAEGGRLKMTASYAHQHRRKLMNDIAPGDGIVGQAALEGQIIEVSDVPEGYLAISSGLGESAPRHLVAMPFTYNNEVVGVIELGSFTEFGGDKIEFLRRISEPIAISINSAESRAKLQDLYEETQAQAEELQSQQEELRQTNEELEIQANALKENQMRLEDQQEELKRANEELEEQTRLLEQGKSSVEAKNVELKRMQERLKEKARDLEVSSKYKSEFFANMSHELRTPLNSILILTNLLIENRGGNLTEKQVEFAETIRSSGNELLNLINDILDLSKVESGKLEIIAEDVLLEDLADYVRQNFYHVTREKSLDLFVEFNEGLPKTIRTDRRRVEQIIKNLVSNAVKFTQKGEVRFRIDRPEYDGNKIAFKVSDTGIGIPQDKQKLIFEAFSQIDGTTSRKYGGTGLGLSICREFSRLLGGEITVTSKENEGSTFTLILPEILNAETIKQPISEKIDELDKAIENTTKTAMVNPDKETMGVDRAESIQVKARLLIIEDDPHFSNLLSTVCRKKDFTPIVAETGESGLAMAEEYQPDAIILDLGLPDIDGARVFEILKKSKKTSHIPIHIVSGNILKYKHIDDEALGFLKKPVTVGQLNKAMDLIMEKIADGYRHVLIVENDEAMRESLRELIKARNIELTAVESDREALTELKLGNYDCAVIDLSLPDGSAFELLQTIRSDSSLENLTIITHIDRALTDDESEKLEAYSDKNILRDENSLRNIIDETILFLHKVDTAHCEKTAGNIKIKADKEAMFRGKTILLVDDDSRNVFALSNHLEQFGFNIIVGHNGQEAIDLLEKSGDIDLIIMDIMMPGMDGYDSMRKIRSHGAFSDIPIIALTAKAMRGDRAKCIDAGASDYVSKPVNLDRLMSLLKVWMQKERRAAAIVGGI